MTRDGRLGVAVVTGASAGVGRATAVALAEAGYDVGLLARGRAGLEGAAAEVSRAGRATCVVPTDVADAEAVESAADEVERHLGAIDVWVNGAMATVFGRLADVSPAELHRATEVTYLGLVHGTMAALTRMRPRDRGRIVNVGSALAFVGIPLQAAYCGAKFAARGFTQSVRAELLAEGSAVTITMVHLPAVNTPQFDWCESKLDRPPRPVAPVYQPEAAAAAIVGALDGRRADVFGSWNRVVVSLGQFAPGIASHFAADTAIEGQQDDRPGSGARRSNLWSPVDEDHDVGTRGRFGDEARGVAEPAFLRGLPSTIVELGRSVGASFGDRFRRLRSRRSPAGGAGSTS